MQLHPYIKSFKKYRSSLGTGLIVSPEFRELSNKPGFLRVEDGGQRMRNLYTDGSMGFEPRLLSDFGVACYIGLFEEVKRMIENGSTPDICGHETEYRWGYLTIVVVGRRCVTATYPVIMEHAKIAQFLIDHGAPIDQEDIAKYTALGHATMRSPMVDVGRILLEAGADPNHQNKYGCTPLIEACMSSALDSIDALLEFGADPDIPDADGCKSSTFSLQAGPQVSALLMKWKRNRDGVEPAAREQKICDGCLKPPEPNTTLHLCSRCRIGRYCNSVCQRIHWPNHKSHCQPFDKSNTLILVPFYMDPSMHIVSRSALARKAMGIADVSSKVKTESECSRCPAERELPKQLVVKIQIPFAGFNATPAQQTSAEMRGDCIIYTKKRDLVCHLRRQENGTGYDKLLSVIKAKGVGGLKAYFIAEMRSRGRLIVKVSEVLAEQPF